MIAAPILAILLSTFREVWVPDFEFNTSKAGTPWPVCLVAYELRSGKRIHIWQDELHALRAPPYPTDENTLFVAYYSSAEWGCHRALRWPPPKRVLDLFVEFRNITNGLPVPCGNGLLGALAYFGIDAMSAVEKDDMRNLVLQGGPWTEAQKQSILDYCESDVRALVDLLPRMLPHIDLPRAILRGRYMVAAANMEHVGVPIDTSALAQLRRHWTAVQRRLIARIDADYQVYEGTTFKADRFARYLGARGLAWPRLPSGELELSDDTFREQAKLHLELAPLRELRVSLSQMRLADLSVGGDGRNRCLLSAFRARTSRNQPSNSKFIFGPSVWLRGLIQPQPGWGLAYIDFEQQELAIAAALSRDPKMMEAYLSGDAYLAFAKQAGAVPPDATKKSHKAIRDQFKACALGVQYGMEEVSLAMRIGQPVHRARELLRLHHETYNQFWRWSDAAVDHAMLFGYLQTVFGWTIRVGGDANPRSLRNFPVQANGAEMLRLACCLATERGIRVCAPVHDAVLIEAPLDELDATIAETQKVMAEASRIVLDGFEVRTEAKIIRHPERYMDERGEKMWQVVWEELAELQRQLTLPLLDG